MKKRKPDKRYFVLLLLLAAEALCDNEESWVEPNIWGREGQQISRNVKHSSPYPQGDCFNKIDTISSEEVGVALLYYKKLVTNLFNRKSMQYDDKLATYKRSLVFTVLPHQLEKLEQLNDPRDLDSILTEILEHARVPYEETIATSVQGRGIFVIVFEILSDFAQLLKKSEVQFASILLFATLCGWFLNRRYGFGVLVMIIGFSVLSGYLITYLECNKKLEYEQMLEAIERNQPRTEEEIHWYSTITNLFSFSTPVKESRQEKIKKLSKINLGYCRPDHVLLDYANDIFFKQLVFLIEKCTSTLIMLRNDLPWPWNYLGSFFLLVLIGYILKLTFKYILSPKAWASLLHQHAGAKQNLCGSNAAASAIAEDRISGHNLKLLLNAINTPAITIKGKNGKAKEVPVVSGVQEIIEQLENASSASISPLNSPNTSKKMELIEDITDNALLGNNAQSHHSDLSQENARSEATQSKNNEDTNYKYKTAQESIRTAEKYEQI